MQTKSSFRPLAVTASLLLALSTQAPPVRTQGRGVGVGTSQAGAGGYHALVIGNNEYKSLPRLKTAEQDAREVAALLKDFYGFETKLLLNATRQQITSALGFYRRTLGPEANLLVYYAGHGFNDRDADKAYWLPVDAERDDTSNWIIADEITTAVKVIPARHVLVVSDSCYSGTLTRELPMPAMAPALRQQWLQKMLAGRSRTLMASGGNEPVADGGGGSVHSVFAGALLRGLRQMDKEQFTATELFHEYVEVSVAGGAEQTPEYNSLRNSGHESGDFVFVRVKVDGKRVEEAVGKQAAAVNSAAMELSFWNTIQNSTDPEDFKAYLEKYPDGQFAALARRRTKKMYARKLLLDFDSVDTSRIGHVPAEQYLGEFGVTLRDVTQGTELVIIDVYKPLYDARAIRASSGENVLAHVGSNDPVSFTLNLPFPVKSVSFARPNLLAGPNGITFPEWSARAFSAQGALLSEVGEKLISSYSDVPAKTFTLNGQEIISVKFSSNNHHFAAFNAVIIDDLTFNP